MTVYYGGRFDRLIRRQGLADAIARYGLYAGVVIAAAIIVGWLGLRFAHRRLERRL
jgi:hypothetical protein